MWLHGLLSAIEHWSVCPHAPDTSHADGVPHSVITKTPRRPVAALPFGYNIHSPKMITY